jgi:predicted ATP-dependent protease
MKSWLDAVRTDLIQNAELFLVTDAQAQAGPFPVATTKHYRKAQFRRYTVNVMVSNTQDDDIGAPVEDENLPTLANIVGRVEYASEMGALLTDFTMIKPGALHRANGGYLILDARQILSEPFAWEALKRSIKSREIAIISPAERYGMMMTTSLEPDPIPLDVRVVLVGERILYYLLSAHDPEFPVLFKLQADFNDDVFMTPESMAGYGALVSSIAFNAGLRSPDRAGLERLMVEGTRLADDSEKLSLDLGRLSDILREADYWADGAGNGSITAQDIDRAVSEQERRAGRIRELGQEAIRRNTLLIETDGEVVGQINALSVMQIGAVAFGRPSRVTARVRMGRGKVVDIEREVELGGPLHSKGMLILSSFLASHYALDTPLSLWASIVFEQSYGGVDGDSASAAELFALLSALSEAPISQSFAVTGSVNQNGRIQAIGGVNHKIEGFFDVCADRGLTGRQGVLIPDSNVKHLALRSRVIEAVEAGRFRIIPIATIDEGITLLTGKDAGERQSGGSFPPDTINALVEKRLRGFAEKLKQFGSEEEGRNGAGKS